jgi:putative flippase GtrA
MVAILSDTRERNRFIRFAFVGVIGAVVDFGTFNILVSVVMLPAVWASILSFMAAVVSNFTWNRYWTYPDSRSKPVSHQMLTFLIISLIGLAIRTPLFVYLEKAFNSFFTALHIESRGWITPEFLAHNLALAAAVIVVMFWNFFVNRYWTYSDVPQ